jgi:hypothetical protein
MKDWNVHFHKLKEIQIYNKSLNYPLLPPSRKQEKKK